MTREIKKEQNFELMNEVLYEEEKLSKKLSAYLEQVTTVLILT